MAHNDGIFSVSSLINPSLLESAENKKTKDQHFTWKSTKSLLAHAQPLDVRFSSTSPHASSPSSPERQTPPGELVKTADRRILLSDGIECSDECSELQGMSRLDADSVANSRSMTSSGPSSAATQDEMSAFPPPSPLPHHQPPTPPMPQKAKQPFLSLDLCYCRRDLLPIKLFYFSFIGALGVVYPYMSVFLKQIGLSAVQIGVIAGLRPVLGFVSAPVWGSVADRFNLRRTMLIVSMLAWLGFFVGFYFLTAPALTRTPFPQQPTLHRYHARFRRTAQALQQHQQHQQPFYDAAAMTTVVDDNGTDELLRLNDSRCNYSNISAEDKELLKENLSWIYDPSEVYWKFIICMIIICGGELFQAPTTALTDAATLQVLGRENIAQYGAQRAWGPIGWAISSLSVGCLLNANRLTQTVCGIELSFSDYRLIAYIFIVIMLFGLIAAFTIDFKQQQQQQQQQQGPNGQTIVDNGRVVDRRSAGNGGQHSTLAVFKLFINIHYGSWILTTFFVGLLNGIIWGFLFWHLDNLGGTQLLMGVDSVVMCVCEFTAFFFVDHVIRIVGHMGIMYIGLVGYAIRFLIYASITNPWLVLPAEALQGVTFSFIWVSLTSYTAIAVPSVSLATMQGIVHGVYFGLGNGLGHLVGGLLIGNYGAVTTFYSFAAATAVWLLVFVLCQKFSKKPNIGQFSYQDISAPD